MTTTVTSPPNRGLIGAAERLGAGLAITSNRRRFIGAALRGAFIVGATGAMVGDVLIEPAAAVGCGPSPYCSSCNWGSKKCGSGCKNATYGHSSCGGASPGCWVINNGGAYRLCCDCCCPTGGSACTASSCGGRKCICEFSCC